MGSFTEMKKVDYLVVGQGIAGTVLAHVLLKKGKAILVVDEPSLSSCSRISAGMYNPVVIRRLTKSWMADVLLPELQLFYADAGKLLGETLAVQCDIVKIFAERAERDFWESKRKEEVGRYLSAVSDEAIRGLGHTPFGHACISPAGYVKVPEFLSLSRELFRQKGILREEKFDHRLMRHLSGSINYEDVEAEYIVLCEGYKAGAGLSFAFVPFAPAKGELLTVRIADFPLMHTVHKGVSITPVGNSLFRAGSTFAWDELNDLPTEAAKEELLEGLRKVVKEKIEVVEHKAGVRPAVNDRRPVLGRHPHHHHLAIFNGLGSKGIMLAPYFAGVLADHLESQKPLPREVDVMRFWKQ
jgi:glycine oxidase